MVAVYDPEEIDKAEAKPKKAADPAGVSGETEAITQHENLAGGGAKNPAKLHGWIGGNRKRTALLAAGIAALIAAISVALFLALLPLKINHIVQNLQDRFFASSDKAMTAETDVLFSNYLKRYIIPAIGTCKAGSTIDKSCQPKGISGNSYVSRLYTGWRNGQLENKLAVNYGVEFKVSKGRYFIKTANTPGRDGIELSKTLLDTNNSETLDDFLREEGNFNTATRTQIRAGYKNALEGETLYKKVYLHFKVGRLLEEKYGIRRCIVFCKTTDKFADWKDSKKLAAKAYLIDRVIGPRSVALSLVLQCVLAATVNSTGGISSICDPKDITSAGETSDKCELGVNCALNGEPTTKWEKELQAKFAAFRAIFGNEAADKLLAKVEAIRKGGYVQYVFDQKPLNDANATNTDNSDPNNPLNNAGNENPTDFKTCDASCTDAQKAAVDAFNKDLASKFASLVSSNLGSLQMINTIAGLISGLPKAAEILKKMTYVTQTASMVAMFSMYRTYADEVKTGNVDPTIVGSFTDSLNGGTRPSDFRTPQIGGTAEPETTPLYPVIINNKVTPITSAFGGTAYAATTSTTSPYQCSNGFDANGIICNEDNPRYNGIAQGIGNAYQNEPLKVLKIFADGWVSARNTIFAPLTWLFNDLSKAFGSALNFLISALGRTFPTIAAALDKIIQRIAILAVNVLIPSPISSVMSGGRSFVSAAGGADVTANEYAHHGLGAEALNPDQTTTALHEQQDLQLATYHNKSFFSRMFDTESNYSLVNKLAVAMPDSAGSAQTQLARFVSNPFNSMLHGFGSIFSGGRAYAIPAQGPDPFYITQYGYPEDDPVFTTPNPEDYWMKYCAVGDGSTSDVNMAVGSITNDYNSKQLTLDENYIAQNRPNTKGVKYNTDGCLLMQAAIGSAGATSDPSLLTADDLSDGSSSSTQPSPTGDPGGTTDPTDVIDLSTLYNSSVSINCAAGTRNLGIQTGYAQGNPVQIRLCALPNLKSTGEESTPGNAYYVANANGNAIVNSVVSKAFFDMIAAAKSAGISTYAGSSFRTMAHQQALCASNAACNSGDYTSVAKPGTSNHQMGLAIDFGDIYNSVGGNSGSCNPKETSTTATYKWLEQNAATFSIKQYCAEAWHWSPTGS